MNITIEIGEGSIVKEAQILVTTPNYFMNKLEGRSEALKLRQVKMVVFDEADEIFKYESNLNALDLLINKYFEKHKVNPQYLLFSATYDDDIINNISKFLDNVLPFRVKKQALNLKGVK